MENQAIAEFVKRVQEVTKLPGVVATGITGTTSKQSVKMDLQRETAKLAQTDEDMESQIEKVAGALNLAQATNAISTEELDELFELLGKIKGE